MSKRSKPISLLAVFLVTVWTARAATASPADESHLEDVAMGICHDTSFLARALGGAEDIRRQREELQKNLGRGNEEEQRSAFVKNKMGEWAEGAQDQVVAGTRRSLEDHKSEYRRLTGKDFDLSACDGSRLRVTNAMRQQAQREKDERETSAMMDKALADGEAYRQFWFICKDWQTMQRPAEEMERARPGYQAEARERFAAFSSDYQRKNGKPFDTKICR